MEEIRIDMRERTPEEQAMYDKQAQLMFKLSHTMPRTEEYMSVLKELPGDRIGEGSYVAAPVSGAAIDKLIIGKNVFINSNFLAMARVGITPLKIMWLLPQMFSCSPTITTLTTGIF